jgi:hypothetical protein
MEERVGGKVVESGKRIGEVKGLRNVNNFELAVSEHGKELTGNSDETLRRDYL